MTEGPGSAVTQLALHAAMTRYSLLRTRSAGRDVLEVACGMGSGLGMLADTARSVVAGDVVWSNVVAAARVAQGRARVLRFSAEHLPFRGRSLDIVALLEVLYFVADARESVREAHRVLRAHGELVVAQVNPAWRDFQPSVFSRRYYDSQALRALLVAEGFDAEIFAAFPAPDDPVSRAASVLRRLSFRLALPWPPKVRERIRAILHGGLVPFPADLSSLAIDPAPVVTVAPGTIDRTHQVLYAVAMKR